MTASDGGELSSILTVLPAPEPPSPRRVKRSTYSRIGRGGKRVTDPNYKLDLERRVDIACKRLSSKALDVLERAMDETKTPDIEYKYRIMAAKEILDRAYGKPKQAIEASVTLEGGEAFLKMMQEARERAKKPT